MIRRRTDASVGKSEEELKEAGIAYRTGKNLPTTGNGSWHLYTQPVTVTPGETLQATACRLGFRDSQIVSRAIP